MDGRLAAAPDHGVRCAFCCLTSAGSLLLFFLPSSFYSGLAVTAIFGLSLAGLLMLTDLLIADMVDADELQTGARREGLVFRHERLHHPLRLYHPGHDYGHRIDDDRLHRAFRSRNLSCAAGNGRAMGFRIMIAGLPALAMVAGLFLIEGL